MVAALTQNAVAQESGQPWIFQGQTYNTQYEAELAIKAQGGAYQYVDSVRERQITETDVQLTYGIAPETGQVRDWSAYLSGNSGGTKLSEQALVDALIAHYTNRSTSLGCAPSTSVVRKGDWRPFNKWSDGVAWRELADFEVRYVGTAVGGATCQNLVTNEPADRQRTRCSQEFLTWNQSGNVCTNDSYTATIRSSLLACDACNMVGNPADVSTGDKYETEPDFDLGWVSFARVYHSAAANNGNAGFGHGWGHTHEIRLAINSDGTLGLIQANGSQLGFKNVDTGIAEAGDGSGDRIVQDGSQWRLYRADEVLVFDETGKLLERLFEDGTRLTYAYDSLGRLATITHSTGRSLDLVYDRPSAQAAITAINTGGAQLVGYGYNANGQVQTAQYPGGTARTYHYEDAAFPRHLTGITNEQAQRYSTFSYDTQGRLLVSQHAGGADKVALSYTAAGGAIVTDALGYKTTYGLNDAGAYRKPRKPGNVVDSRGSIVRTYVDDFDDFRRRLDTVTDRNGTQTKHSYAEANDPVTGQPARTHTVKEA
ncbi:DUF6531 domain-containing protein, partial [Lysobacter antibioticus]|uniref:DUF6531 domain-containing protein n=1 Tax=Lysobacter antibioticus TaxID=84531 RepID=UPI0016453D82